MSSELVPLYSLSAPLPLAYSQLTTAAQSPTTHRLASLPLAPACGGLLTNTTNSPAYDGLVTVNSLSWDTIMDLSQSVVEHYMYRFKVQSTKMTCKQPSPNPQVTTQEHFHTLSRAHHRPYKLHWRGSTQCRSRAVLHQYHTTRPTAPSVAPDPDRAITQNMARPPAR